MKTRLFKLNDNNTFAIVRDGNKITSFHQQKTGFSKTVEYETVAKAKVVMNNPGMHVS